MNTGGKRRICLVTGGARGFGRSISRRFAELGHDVAVMDMVSAEETAKLVCQTGGRFLAIKADISVRQNVDEAALEIAAKLGSVDILVANATICPIAQFLQTSWEVGAAPWT